MGFLAKQQPTNASNSFWSKPEGKWGAGGIVLIALALGVAVYKLLPTLIAFVNGAADLGMALVRLAFIIGVPALLIFFMTRPKMRTMLFFWYRGLMSLMVNGYINKNYVQIMRTYIERMTEKALAIKTHTQDVSRNKSRMEGEMRRYEQSLKEDLEGASEAKRLMNETQDQSLKDKCKQKIAKIQGRLGTTRDAITARKVEVDRLAMMLKVLEKLGTYSDAMVEKLSYKVETMVEQHKSVAQARSAFANAREIAFGGNEERNFFDQSMETMTAKTDADVGDIEAMMNELRDPMNSHDVDTAISEAAGRKMLEEWEAKMDAKLGDNFSYLDEGTTLTAQPEAVKLEAKATSTDSAASKWLK